MTLHPIPSEFPYIWGKFCFLFYQCMHPRASSNDSKTSILTSLLFMFYDSHTVSDAWTKDISLTQEKFHLAVTHSYKRGVFALVRDIFYKNTVLRALFPRRYLEDCQMYFKGIGSPDGLRYFLYVWIATGLNKCRGWFSNFLGVPLICHFKNKISCGKCKHKLAYNVSGAI